METWPPRGFGVLEWKVQQIYRSKSTSSSVTPAKKKKGLHISWALPPHFTCGLQTNLTVLSQLKPHITGHRCWGVRDELGESVWRPKEMHACSPRSLCLLLCLPLDSVQSKVRSCLECGEIICCRSAVAVPSCAFGVSYYKVMSSLQEWRNVAWITYPPSLNKSLPTWN